MTFAPTVRRTLRQRLAALLLCGLAGPVAPGARAADTPAAPPVDCPPVATAPTEAQMRSAVAQARDRGLLWRIERDGQASHLYGTVHIGKLAWTVPGPRVRQALMAADTLALELDFTDPAMARKLAAMVAAPDGGHGVPLPPALQARLARLVEAACLPPDSLQGQHPVIQALSLTLMSARREGLDPAFAQEFSLAGFMRALQRNVVSLETPELQMAALVPADPAQSLRMVQQMVEQLEAQRAQALLLRLADVWERGDLAQIERYEAWCDCVETEDDRQQMQRLNDARNPGLADRIEALHREGRQLFVAVGALHMTGPQALPRLLAQRGFRVERVPLR